MTALTTNAFRQTMADHAAAVVVFSAGAAVDGETAVTALRGLADPSGPWFWTRVDVAASPEIAGMFGIADDLPAVLVMREEVVLYCAPFDPANAGPTRTIIDRAAMLDMAQVHRDIAQERESMASLFARRVCPTAWRR
jgi:hypothetical protein